MISIIECLDENVKNFNNKSMLYQGLQLTVTILRYLYAISFQKILFFDSIRKLKVCTKL